MRGYEVEKRTHLAQFVFTPLGRDFKSHAGGAGAALGGGSV